MQYCKCTNDFVNAIIDDYFNSFKIRKDLTEGLVYEWTNSTEQIHDRYSDEEIKTLWSKLYEINNVDIILIMIYTGLRPTELLEIQTENVHLDEKYMVGGMKTEAGKDRIIPLNDQIIPLVKNRYDGQVILDDQGLPVTKAKGHGIGMKSLDHFRQTYDASVLCTYEDGWFSTYIRVPWGEGSPS